MSFKSQVIGLNEFLSTIYGREMRISLLLETLGFNTEEINVLRGQHLEILVLFYTARLQERLLTGSDGARLTQIIIRRYGLDGEVTEPLQQLGERLGVTRERIRQLEEKGLRRCRHKANLRYWEAELSETARGQLKANMIGSV